jgi:23S rRNA pseudouridine2457 synthase
MVIHRLALAGTIRYRPGAVPLILLNKPFQVLSQFRDADGRAVLADHVRQKGVYPAGRLDFTSEGLLLLTDAGRLQARIASPSGKLVKRYWVQVEGIATKQQISALVSGVELKDGPASAASAAIIDAPLGLWQRDPPVRQRKSIPTTWLDIGITEGRNRQVRRMTAAVGLPTLRLIRHAIGPWALGDLQPGESVSMSNEAAWRRLS